MLFQKARKLVINQPRNIPTGSVRKHNTTASEAKAHAQNDFVSVKGKSSDDPCQSLHSTRNCKSLCCIDELHGNDAQDWAAFRLRGARSHCQHIHTDEATRIRSLTRSTGLELGASAAAATAATSAEAAAAAAALEVCCDM